jgi:hypothetical protein
MALAKKVVVDQITVTENGTVLYREATRIMEDGVQLSQTYHRSSLAPEADLPLFPNSKDEIKSDKFHHRFLRFLRFFQKTRAFWISHRFPTS